MRVVGLDIGRRRRRQRAAHRQPVDDLDRLGAAELDELLVGVVAQRLGLLGEQAHELPVPLGRHRAEPRPGELVRQPAGADHDDRQVLGVGEDRPPDRLAELPAAPRGGQRMQDDVDRERHDRDPPVRPPPAKSTIGSGEITPWSTSSSWQIVMSNSSATSERAMCQPSAASPGERRERPRAEALVGDRVAVGDAQRERRVGVEEELVHVVVVDDDQPVGPELREPLRDLLERPEERLPFVVRRVSSPAS